MIVLKSAAELEKMRAAGRIVGPLRKPDAIKPIFRFVDSCAFGVAKGGQTEHADDGVAGCQHEWVVLRDQQIF